VYLLPFTPENQEQFQWLTQEVQKEGGEATLLTVDQIQNLKLAEVMRLFQQARDVRRFRLSTLPGLAVLQLGTGGAPAWEGSILAKLLAFFLKAAPPHFRHGLR